MTDRTPVSVLGNHRIGESSFREHLELIRTRPGLDGSYGDYVTRLHGYDAGAVETAHSLASKSGCSSPPHMRNRSAGQSGNG
jgi:hypothetical protein